MGFPLLKEGDGDDDDDYDVFVQYEADDDYESSSFVSSWFFLLEK